MPQRSGPNMLALLPLQRQALYVLRCDLWLDRGPKTEVPHCHRGWVLGDQNWRRSRRQRLLGDILTLVVAAESLWCRARVYVCRVVAGVRC